jgi:hypothetical protein
VDATPLAYQFFGHPQLKVVRQGAPAPVGARPGRASRPLVRAMLGEVLRRTRREQCRTLADVARAARVSRPRCRSVVHQPAVVTEPVVTSRLWLAIAKLTSPDFELRSERDPKARPTA